ncbi:MAG: hypothetical protein R3E42_16080 [Burkholderiaceae bacterium]
MDRNRNIQFVQRPEALPTVNSRFQAMNLVIPISAMGREEPVALAEGVTRHLVRHIAGE